MEAVVTEVVEGEIFMDQNHKNQEPGQDLDPFLKLF